MNTLGITGYNNQIFIGSANLENADGQKFHIYSSTGAYQGHFDLMMEDSIILVVNNDL